MIGAILAGAYGDVAPQFDFESIATVTVGSGGAADIQFTSIPGTYQHLQLRMKLRSDRSAQTLDSLRVQVNGATGSVYSWHELSGSGSAAGADASSSTTNMALSYVSGANATTSVFGVAVIDVLDYTDTNKYSTFRSLSGMDNNGSGYVALYSGLYQATTAITSIKLDQFGGSNWVQYSHAALYGIRG
jgi:hypothetical protein